MKKVEALKCLEKSMPCKEEFQPSHTPLDVGKYVRSCYEIDRSKIIEDLIPRGQRREALDIGAGPGYFSQILSGKDWVTTAIDSDPQNAESLKKFSNRVILGDAVNVLSSLKPDCYDLILALEIIEHMPKSLGQELVEKIKRVLSPEGKLMLSTPNRFSPEGLGGYYFGEKIRGRKWKAWDETHIYIYNSWEIIRLVRESGFGVDKVTGYWYDVRFPFGTRLRSPLRRTQRFPLNRLGFNIILECSKSNEASG